MSQHALTQQLGLIPGAAAYMGAGRCSAWCGRN